jgi:hypothetical protein
VKKVISWLLGKVPETISKRIAELLIVSLPTLTLFVFALYRSSVYHYTHVTLSRDRVASLLEITTGLLIVSLTSNVLLYKAIRAAERDSKLDMFDRFGVLWTHEGKSYCPVCRTFLVYRRDPQETPFDETCHCNTCGTGYMLRGDDGLFIRFNQAVALIKATSK